jgi:hypothetical protein
MLSFFKKLFNTKANNISFPKISFGFRGEDLDYIIKNDSLYIITSWINGRRIFTDSIQYWKSNAKISDSDKAIIFKDIVEFINTRTKENPIIVINVDHDKEIWENLCETHKERIKSIEYQSDKEKDRFLYDSLLNGIRRGNRLINGNQTITTEEQFIQYWNNRRKI